MTEPIQSTPDDATLPGRADGPRVDGSGDSTLPASGNPDPSLPAAPIMKGTERYQLAVEVARGGMGAILRVTDLSIKRTVAMKVALKDVAADPELIRRFTQEAELTGQLEHPNIVPVHDLSLDEEGQPFYTMKFVKGITLQAILTNLRQGDAATVAQYPLAHLLTVFQKVCDAVAFAHSKHVIHRDLKPENIMVGKYGEVLVMDWGLAKVVGGQGSAVSGQRSAVGAQQGWAKVSDLAHPATEGLVVDQQTYGQEDGSVGDRRQTEDSSHQLASLPAGSPISDLQSLISSPPALTLAGQIMGSPQYMAPEQAAGELDKLDARTDIFALGGVLYNILTLHPPVTGTTIPELLQQILDGAILPPTFYNPKTGRKATGTIKVGTKSFPQPPLIPLKHCPGGRIPESLGAVAMKALALRREDRYQTVPELQKDIEAYQGGFATRAEHASAWRQLALLIKRHQKEFALAAVALLILVATVAGFLVKVTKERNRAEVQRQRAEVEKSRAEVNEQRAETEKARAQTERDRAEKTLGQLHDTAPTFYAQAQVLIEQRQWPEAMAKASFAASLAPEVADYQVLYGNLLQSSLRMAEAREAYAAALHRQPDHKLAKENLDLCEAFLRAEDGKQPYRVSNLKPLQSAMLEQGRVAEAGAFARFYGQAATNRVELVAAYSNALVQAGVSIRNFGWAKISDLMGNAPFSAPFSRSIGEELCLEVTDFTNATLAVFQGMPLNALQLGGAKKVRDLQPLQGMPLHYFGINSEAVTDLRPLQGMKLQSLWLLRTQVADLTPLRGMPLQKIAIQYSEVSDLSPLQGMPLKVLNMEAAKISDLTPLTGMQLTHLSIVKNKLSDLTPLRGMPLTALGVGETLVSDLSPLKGMPLNGISINNTLVKDLSPLAGMPLTTLNASYAQIDDLTPLKGLPLSQMHVSGNPITDLSPLRGMPLKDLDLFECTKLQDLSPLTNCLQLTRLSLPSTCKDVECLRSHPTLKQLGYGRMDGTKRPEIQNLPTVAEFWKAYDAAKTNVPAAKPTKP